MISAIGWLLVAILACVGFVQVAGYLAVQFSKKGSCAYKVFPVGGAGSNPDAQMAFFYTSLQWESNPARQIHVLYNAGLKDVSEKECEKLAKECGALYADSPEELARLLKSPPEN